jgi:hypothetical protein
MIVLRVRSLLEVKLRELTPCATLRVLTHRPGADEVSDRRQARAFFVASIVHDVTNKDQTAQNPAAFNGIFTHDSPMI